MNKAAIIASILGVVVVGGGLYVVSSGSSSNTGEGQSNNEVSGSPRDVSGTGTFLGLLERGDSLTCDISYTDEEGSTMDGTVFFSDGNMRGDFTMQFDGEQMETHVIHDGEYAYSWGASSAGNMAVKFPIDEPDDAEMSREEPATGENGQFDFDQEVAYDCSAWRTDASKFVPPADIEFVDLEAQMNAMFDSSSTAGGAGQCAACEQIPDAAAQSQCRAALGCQ